LTYISNLAFIASCARSRREIPIQRSQLWDIGILGSVDLLLRSYAAP
jgi:hypothetical protein